MRNVTAKIRYRGLHEEGTLTKQAIFPAAEIERHSLSFRLQQMVLSKLLRIREGLLFIFSTSTKETLVTALFEEYKTKGLIGEYGYRDVYCDYPKLSFFGARVFIEPQQFFVRSWGYVLPFEDTTLAIKKTFWESLERQASYYYAPGSTVTSYPICTTGDASFLYDHVPLPTKSNQEKYPFLLQNKNDLTAVKGFSVSSLTKRGTTFLPHSLFYWGDMLDPTERAFQESTTSGSGGGESKEAAIVSGIYELLERDSFLLFWSTGIAPPRITFEKEEGSLFEYIKDAQERFNLEIYFFDTRYDVDVASCVCVIIDPVLHIIAFGAKTSLSGVLSMKGAFTEALATLISLRSGEKIEGIENYIYDIVSGKKVALEKIDKKTRVQLYNSPFGIETFRKHWLHSNTHNVPFSSFAAHDKNFMTKKEELKYVKGLCEQLVLRKGEGYHVYYHFFDSLWCREYDYEVAHVFIPSLLKLHLREPYSALFGARLQAFAKDHQVDHFDEDTLTRLPHPFP